MNKTIHYIFSTIVFIPIFLLIEKQTLKIRTHPDLDQCRADYQNCMLHYLTDSIYRKGNYNGVLLVAENGKVIFKKAFGRRKYDKNTTFTTQTAMQLASVSKPFTALAVLMLVERNKLSLNDKLVRYFPTLPYKEVTIKHLLNHTSGIPCYLNQKWKYKRSFYRKEYITNQDLINYLGKRHPKPFFQAGKRHKYSNTGYALLASIVEKVSGQKFTDFMQKHIFDTVGMSHTFFFDRNKKIIMQRENDPLDGIYGDKGMFSTVDDMFAWDQALYSNKLVSQKTLQQAYEQGTLDHESGEKFDYGYGWRMIREMHQEPIIYHKGLWQGANPMMIRFVGCNRTIISLHPADNFNSWSMTYAIRDILNQSEAWCYEDF